MSKIYGITHCYTDLNRGDAEIIIQTIKLIKRVDPNGKILLFSVFGANDKRFTYEHQYIEKYANGLLPALLPNPLPIFGLGDKSRIIAFAFFLFRALVLLLTQNKLVLSLLFSRRELSSITCFCEADVLISKGGSYITTQNSSARQLVSLMQMLYPFYLSQRYNRDYIIFSQSLGPISGSLQRLLVKSALRKVKRVFLRESICLKTYPYLKSIVSMKTVSFVPDTAFFHDESLSLKQDSASFLSAESLKVGMTLVDHPFKYLKNPKEVLCKRKSYKESICCLIQYLVNTYSATVTIYPQVTIKDPHLGICDTAFAKNIAENLGDLIDAGRLVVLDGEYSPSELRKMYGEMDIFIGTRLHSAIFAMSLGIPVVNISYHGTKSEGVLKAILPGYDLCVDINSLNPRSLINKCEYVIANRSIIRSRLLTQVPLAHQQLINAMSLIVNKKW